jgi:hypothetical protein
VGDKPKDDIKSNVDKPKDKIITKNDDDVKQDGHSSTSTNDPSTTSVSDTSTAPTSTDSDSSLTTTPLSSSTDNPPLTPITSTTSPTTTSSSTPLTTTDQTIVSNDILRCPDGYKMSSSGDCKLVINTPLSQTKSVSNSSSAPSAATPSIISSPSSASNNNQSSGKLGTNTSQLIPGNISQSLCDPRNANCSLPDNTQCSDGYNISPNGECVTVFDCDSSLYDNCPVKICHIDKNDCTKGLTCPEGYWREGIKGDCKRHVPCESSEDCIQICNLFKGDCPGAEIICNPISTNSTNIPCHKPENDKENNVADQTDSVIKFYITNPMIQQQVAQQPANALIPMDTLQF